MVISTFFQAHLAAVSTLVRVSPESIMSALMDVISASLQQPDLATVTMEEYNIMLTPEGELYDRSILEK